VRFALFIFTQNRDARVPHERHAPITPQRALIDLMTINRGLARAFSDGDLDHVGFA
jgi:hypothetical protein